MFSWRNKENIWLNTTLMVISRTMKIYNKSLVTKTCLYNFDSLKPHFYTVKLGFTGIYINFLISAQKHNCGYLLELPQWGSSNKYPQIMFWAEIWKISEFLSENFQFLEVKFSIYLNRHVFVMYASSKDPKQFCNLRSCLGSFTREQSSNVFSGHLQILELQISSFVNTVWSGPEVIKLFSWSTQLSIKFVLLINLKLLTNADSFLLNTAEHENFSLDEAQIMCVLLGPANAMGCMDRHCLYTNCNKEKSCLWTYAPLQISNVYSTTLL